MKLVTTRPTHLHIPAVCGLCHTRLCANCGAEATPYDVDGDGLLKYSEGKKHECPK